MNRLRSSVAVPNERPNRLLQGLQALEVIRVQELALQDAEPDLDLVQPVGRASQRTGEVLLIDEALTPDSSRFWPAEKWSPGTSPPSFDKQILRDWLETLDWNKTAPGPELPDSIVTKTAEKYEYAKKLLME